MKVLTFSFDQKDGLVNVRCTLGDKFVDKTINKDARPVRFAAVLDDDGGLADIEVVTIS